MKQIENPYLSRQLDIAGAKANYDKYVKKILSDKNKSTG